MKNIFCKILAVSTDGIDWLNRFKCSFLSRLSSMPFETYLSRIENAFSQIPNKALYPSYMSQIILFLKSQESNEIPPKLIAKVLDTFTTNVLDVLKDTELTDSIKALIIEKMPQMSLSLLRMYSRDPKAMLLSQDKTNLFAVYTDVSLALKKALIKDKHPAGITFTPRSPKLFVWVREAIADTTNPLVGLFCENPKCSEIKHDVQEKFSKLFDIANMLVLQIACGDDVSDNIQDEELTTAFAKIPFNTPGDLEVSRRIIREHREGVFVEYFETAVAIWNEAITQLKELFGEAYFEGHVREKFLQVHATVMGSLTYSQHMNSNPHDSTITQASISANLDPNIMVECVRTLEACMVEKLAHENGVLLPSAEDLEIVKQIVKKSQKNAAYSNAAATAPREQKENDISSPVPFALNALYNQTLHETHKTFAEEFTDFLEAEGYHNHFFATYLNTLQPPPEFDYLNLLLLRREALTQMMEQLFRLTRRGVLLPDSDYHVDSLAIEAIKYASASLDESLIKGSSLIKLKEHIRLIDKFSEKLLVETRVQDQFFTTWEKEIESLRIDASQIKDEPLKEHTLRYIDSWQLFLCMYLIFKRSFDGTV